MAEFTKLRDGDLWVWQRGDWVSRAYPYLEERPWTPTLVGGNPCFVAADRSEPGPEARWRVVWDSAEGPWFDDVWGLSDHCGRPLYVAVEYGAGGPVYGAVWGGQASQGLGFQIALQTAGDEVFLRRFDSRRGPDGPSIAARWHDLVAGVEPCFPTA